MILWPCTSSLSWPPSAAVKGGGAMPLDPEHRDIFTNLVAIVFQLTKEATLALLAATVVDWWRRGRRGPTGV